MRACQKKHRSDLTMMIIKPHANRKNMFSKCHIESFFLCDMWKNQKRSKFLYPCNDFEQKFIHQKNSFKISLLGLNFSIILQKVPSKPPLKITLTNRLCKIKLNNKKKSISKSISLNDISNDAADNCTRKLFLISPPHTPTRVSETEIIHSFPIQTRRQWNL